jgi:hypothetical protein
LNILSIHEHGDLDPKRVATDDVSTFRVAVIPYLSVWNIVPARQKIFSFDHSEQ